MITPLINKYQRSKDKSNLNKRQQDIVNFAKRDGFVTVEILADSFKVTHKQLEGIYVFYLITCISLAHMEELFFNQVSAT